MATSNTLQSLLADQNIMMAKDAAKEAGVCLATMVSWVARFPGLGIKVTEGIPGRGLVFVRRDRLQVLLQERERQFARTRVRRGSMGKLEGELRFAA